MLVKDILGFNRDIYFNGAVQADWFYDNGKRNPVAQSYVFHGARYYGVSQGEKRLIDTISYTERLNAKVNDEDDNNLFLTISGYGTGKSHLAVMLAALFSGDDENLRKSIIAKTAKLDKDAGARLKESVKGRNIVIVLNGMNNFSLDYEILRCAKCSMAMHGYSEDVFDELLDSYKSAVQFVQNSYELLQLKFKEMLPGMDKQGIITDIEKSEVYEAVNNVYKEINGSYIPWTKSVSAGDVLTYLADRFCGDGKEFNKVIVLFDEFGRYMEYAAAHPSKAGDSSFQQIFEAVQNSENIILDAFVQSDLGVYLARVDKTSNISRYIGRYNNSEKIYISTNFETILANLIEHRDEEAFDRIVKLSLEDRYAAYHERVYSGMKRWISTLSGKYVWKDIKAYNNVILNGTYPLHPVTVWVLSSFSGVLQQRSSMTFAEELFNRISESSISIGELPYIYPYELLDTGIYMELLNAEENGSLTGQYTMLYREIISKTDEQLSEIERRVLKGIVIMNLARMSCFDRNDAVTSLKYLCGISEDEAIVATEGLENTHGVINYDDGLKRFVPVAAASGKNEYRRVFLSKKVRFGVKISVNDCDSDEYKLMDLDKSEKTAFPMKNHISSFEWVYDKKLMPIEEFSISYARELKEELKHTYKKFASRGIMLFLYAGANSQEYVHKAQEVYLAADLENACVVVRIIEDTQEELLEAMRTRRIIASFSKEERVRFEKFVIKTEKSAEYKIGKTFFKLSDERYILSRNGLEKYAKPIRNYCDEKFERIYSKVVPFVFDGFEKKLDNKVKRYLATICRALLDGTIKNKQSYYAMDRQYQNRIKSALSIKAANSWRVFDEETCEIIEPQNTRVAQMIEDAEKAVEERQRSVSRLFREYMSIPYGMNSYSLALLISYFIAKNKDRAVLFRKGKRVRIADIVQEFIVEKNTTVNIKTEAILNAEICFTQRSDERPLKAIVQRIKLNKYAENCMELGQELERIIMEENCEAEDGGIIEVAKIRLKEGFDAAKKVNDEMTSVKESMQKLRNGFTIVLAYKVCALIGKRGLIEEGKQYIYSAAHDEECEKLKQELLDLINEKGYDRIKNYSCAVTSLSQMKNTFKRSAGEFRKIGFCEYANYVEQMIPVIERRVQAKAKYEQNLSDITRLSIEYKRCANMSYADVVSSIAVLDAKWAYLNELSELDLEVKEKYYNDISAAKEALEARFGKIRDMVSSIYNFMPSVSDMRDIKSLRKRISEVLDLGLDADTENGLKEELARIDRFLRIRSADCETRKDLERLGEEITEFEGTYLEKIVLKFYQRCEDSMDRTEGRWLDRNVERVVPKIPEMKAEKCLLWKNETHRLPGFVSEKGKKRYLEVSELMDLRLKVCRIDGILEMFKSLDAREKDECMKRLRDIYRE